MSLKTSDGVYVCALKLEPYNHQGFAELACNVEETLDDIDPDKALRPSLLLIGPGDLDAWQIVMAKQKNLILATSDNGLRKQARMHNVSLLHPTTHPI